MVRNSGAAVVTASTVAPPRWDGGGAVTVVAAAVRHTFMDAEHADNSRVTLVVGHAWATTSMTPDALRTMCSNLFGLSERKMKNALFTIRVRHNAICPVVTIYAPKKDERLRVHFTGIKNWGHIASTMSVIGDAVRKTGHTFSVEMPEVDLANLKYKLDNLRFRSIASFIRASCHDWVTSLEDLKTGKPINISNDRATILIWASGSVMVMLKRLRVTEDISGRLKQATDLLDRVSHVCSE